jgi:hypothetical protein
MIKIENYLYSIQWEAYRQSRKITDDLNFLIEKFRYDTRFVKMGAQTRFMLVKDIPRLIFLREDIKKLDILTGCYPEVTTESIRKSQKKVKENLNIDELHLF